MRNLFRFLYTYHLVFLFLLLELFSLFLIVNHNEFQRAALSKTALSVSARMHARMDHLREFVALRETNIRLSDENTRLLEQLANLQTAYSLRGDSLVRDTVSRQQYVAVPAKVINTSVNKQYNFLTINKGYEDGMEPDMAVIGPQGAVGIIVQTSRHFSRVMSLLNRDANLSVRFLKNDFFGVLSWPGTSAQRAVLHDIPLHVPVAVGDTLVTSQFSTMFPEGIPVGFVSSFRSDDGNFYTISVNLSTEFQKLHYVTVVKDLLKEESQTLELNTEKP